MDNIYVLNYLVNRRLSKERGKMVSLSVAFFVDLKSTFDSMDREILERTLRERRVREVLIIRIVWM